MRVWLTTVAALLATALYVQLHPPLDLAVGRGALARCPAAFGAWNGTDLSFENAVVEQLAADDLLIRRYRRGDDLVWLCVVYHQNRRLGAHDPRVCYESQGYLVDPATRVTLDAGTERLTANRFIVQRRDDRRVVYYWYVTDGMNTPDADAFRARMALHGALANRSWGAFVRVEAAVRGRDDDPAQRAARDFAARLVPALRAVLAPAAGGHVEAPMAGGRP
ncbi:MAG: EpsI family protein [Candidatus Eisenbacteria bacterium]|uniref:EpsI family protein n=1 Tax=Eiseniibacteriota bacterium TaxID=2212470 RepID=A0A9D6QPK6_UNCEI|nr:EpsI family protein [Candidatus Eisenbacteria bacterium]MBI3540039.1 EpsI family protein [Candidatus Eisenbacteria bacterium]